MYDQQPRVTHEYKNTVPQTRHTTESAHTCALETAHPSVYRYTVYRHTVYMNTVAFWCSQCQGGRVSDSRKRVIIDKTNTGPSELEMQPNSSPTTAAAPTTYVCNGEVQHLSSCAAQFRIRHVGGHSCGARMCATRGQNT